MTAVFAGTVIGIQPTDRPRVMRVRFAVDRGGRGIEGETVEIEAAEQTGANCGYTFRHGIRYLVYARSGEDGRLTTDMCSGTKRAIDAPADLAFLHHVTTNPGGVRIFGQVRRIEEDLVTFGRTDFGGVPGARVQITGGDLSRETITDAGGRFEFSNLPPGTYTPAVSLPAGLGFAGPPLPAAQHQLPPRPVTLTNPSECVEVFSWARTDAQITGQALTPDGRPADDESIYLIAAANLNHSDPRIPHLTVRTGRDGRFTFAFIPSGRYVVGLDLGRRPPPAEFDRRVYHPGTTDPAGATVITVAPGSRVSLGPLTLPEWPRERVVNGQVVWPDGNPAPEAAVTMTGVMTETVPLDPEGRFRVTIPYGAQYSVVATVREPGRFEPARSNVHRVGRNDRDADITLVLRRP